MSSRKAFLRSLLASTFSLSVVSLWSTAGAADQAPKTHYEMAMPHDAFLSKRGTKVQAEYNQLLHLLLDREMLVDPKQRAAMLEKVRPILAEYNADWVELAKTYPSMQRESDLVQVETRRRLALLGDEETSKGLNADAAEADPVKAAQANSILIQNRWTMASIQNDQKTRIEQETEIAADLQKLDRTYSQSNELTEMTLKLSGEAGSEQLHDSLLDTALSMDSASARQQTGLKKIHGGGIATAKLVGKPFAVTGKTPDGKDFTTADWKGKVILVDFWAVWCGPCKAELPKIKKLYEENHDKGLEVVGVSNDYSLDDLAKYTAENKMPWPQLVDADAVKKHTWSSTTLGYGIIGIPRIFVIDRNGKLLDAHANETYKDLVEKALVETPQAAAALDHSAMP